MDIEKSAFLLCFLATIWRRIFACLILYCEHNRIGPSSNILLKSLKYNLLSPTGIVRKIKPFLIKCFNQGFLMPNEFRKNKYVLRTIEMFSEAYKIEKKENFEYKIIQENKFLYNEFSKAFSDEEKNENEEEFKDCLKDLLIDPTYRIDKHCYFCELIDAWDIEIGLVKYKDVYDELITSSLLFTLEKMNKK
jgi:hypothetical protein